jgi:N-methylhydantoinase A
VAIDFSASCSITTSALDEERIGRTLAERAAAFEQELRAKGIASFERKLFVEARYVGQQWELELPVPKAWQEKVSDAHILKQAFDEHHLRLYSVNQPEAPIETTNWRLRLTALLPRPKSVWNSPSDEAVDGDRWVEAWFGDAGLLRTRVIDGVKLVPNREIAGPAIVEEPTTTIVVPPGSVGRLTAAGNYIFEIGGQNV